MTRQCVVRNCKSTHRTENARFSVFPRLDRQGLKHLVERRWREWILALGLPDNFNSLSKYVCNRHFVSGIAAKTLDVSNVDWVPTLNIPQPESVCDENVATDNTQDVSAERYVIAEPSANTSEVDANNFDESAFVIEEVEIESDEDRCDFCLKLPTEEAQVVFQTDERDVIQAQIEYVLGTELDTTISEIKCCESCWASLERFYEFKMCCLTAIASRKKMIELSKVKAVSCENCGEQFDSDGELIEHRKDCIIAMELSDNESMSSLIEPPSVENPTQIEEEVTQHCILCEQTFPSKAMLEEHSDICCNNADSSDAVSESEDEDGIYECDLCLATYKSLAALQFHMNNHYGRKRHKCRNEGCKKSFHSTKTRGAHWKDCGKDKKYVCVKCGTKLSTEDSWSKHVQAHMNPKKRCMICKRHFDDEAIETHWKTHFDEAEDDALMNESYETIKALPKSVWCPECHTALQSERIYELHKMYCALPKPIQSLELECSLCSKKFHSRARYQLHMNKHDGIKTMACKNEGCSRVYSEENSLRAHMTICGRIFVCPVCGITTKYISQHMKLHTHSNPVCKVCDKPFTNWKTLTYHISRKHKGTYPK